MLILHCGFPRTGTSALQAILVGQRHKLEAAGTVFPRRWISPAGPTHHGVDDILRASAKLEEFVRYLSTQPEQNILLSAEIVTFWLWPEARRKRLQRMILAAKAVMPVRCVWTVRRLDAFLCSLYLRRVELGIPLPQADQFVARFCPPDDLFAGLRQVEEAANEVIYLRYDQQGGHNVALLRALGLPECLVHRLAEEIAQARRHNSSLQLKQLVVLHHLDRLSAELGMDLRRLALRRAFRQKGLAFAGDRLCAPVDSAVCSDLHVDALKAADRYKLTFYPQFFAEESVGRHTADHLDPSALKREDLDRLESYVGGLHR